jgi:hypothetical protein
MVKNESDEGTASPQNIRKRRGRAIHHIFPAALAIRLDGAISVLRREVLRA